MNDLIGTTQRPIIILDKEFRTNDPLKDAPVFLQLSENGYNIDVYMGDETEQLYLAFSIPLTHINTLRNAFQGVI